MPNSGRRVLGLSVASVSARRSASVSIACRSKATFLLLDRSKDSRMYITTTNLGNAWHTQLDGPAIRLPSRPLALDRLRPIRRRVLGKLPLMPERKLLARV